MRVILFSIAVLFLTLALGAAPASAQSGYPWCAYYSMRIPAIAITCSDASRSGIPIDREQCGVGA